VGAYIGAAYWFTSSTSFANPAITIGRMFSDTFAGIAPGSVLSFIGAQIIGGTLAIAIIKTLYPAITPADAADIIVPHSGEAGRAPASAAHRNASLSADSPQGPH
jgi:arsenate reductase